MKINVLKKSQSLLAVMIAFLVGLTVLSGCSKKSKIGYMIPKDAVFVVSADVNSIWNKADFDNIDRFASLKLLRQQLKAEDPDAAKIVNELLEDPNACGLKLKDEVFVFKAKSIKSEIVIGCSVKDDDKFEEFLRNLNKKKGIDMSFSDEGKYHFAFSKRIRTAICWNDDKAYIMGIWDVKDAEKDAQKLMTLTEDNSIASDKYFSSVLKERHDMRVFVNFNYAIELMKEENASTYRQISPLVSMYKDMGYCLAYDFEKGSIELEGKIVGPNAEKFEEYYGDFNKDLIDYLPKKTFAATTIAINMDRMLKDLSKIKDLSANLDKKSDKNGLTPREVLKCLTGSIALSVSDISFNRYGDPEPVFTAVIGINNTRIIKKILESNHARHDGDEYQISDNISLKYNNEAVIISNDHSALKAFSKGGTSDGIASVASDAKNGNYMFVDLNLDDYPSSIKKVLGREAAQVIGDIFKSAEIKSSPSDCSFEVSINLKNTKKNSLSFILEYLDDNLMLFSRAFR